MYVREIRIESFRNLRDVSLGPFSPPTAKSDLVILAGPNGGGKSSILELIGYALSNTWGLQWQLRRSFSDFSFAVSIGLTDEDWKLIKDYITGGDYQRNYPFTQEAFDFLNSHRHYYRRFSSKGESYSQQENQENRIHDHCHNIVTNVLRNHYQRALGFFLKADRNYPPDGFQWQQRLFAHEQMRQKNYIWSLAYTTSDVQYRDMYDFLIQQRYHYLNQLGEYYDLRDKEKLPQGTQRPEDPLKPYDTLLTKLFPEYSFGEKREIPPSNLYVRLPEDKLVAFTDLSSGEKEVFFLLSFFIRHSVSNAVIAIDEPELHLHPELARNLVRVMLEVQPGNQIWLATHNAEIIDEAGRDKTIYISRGENTSSEVVLGTDEPAIALHLRSLFGVSGYIGIAKNMVFLEGEMTSADRKLFSRLFSKHMESVKLIPTGGVDNLGRINVAVLSILDGTIGYCRFYLIRDRDYLTPSMISAYNNHTSGRLYVLKRNQIENYLLDEEVIATVLREIFQVEKTAEQVHQDLIETCRIISGEVLRDMVSFRINLLFRPQDFGLGKLLQKQAALDRDNEWLSEQVDAFASHLRNSIRIVEGQIKELSTDEAVGRLLDECKAEIKTSLASDSWRDFFPGKRLLEELSKHYGLKNQIAFQNTLIKELAANPMRIPAELSELMESIAAGENLFH